MCNTGCCSTNVPVRNSSHAECHCHDVHLCESPVIEKRVSNCNDGCCSSTTVAIKNTKQVKQYVDNLSHEHCGYSEHDMCRTLSDLSVGVGNGACCTTTGCADSCGTSTPLYYEELSCNTAPTRPCCDSHTYGLANMVRGHLNHNCHTYGNIKPTIKEVPASNVFLVNHVFIDLLISNILGCLPTQNMSKEVVDKVCYYTEQYYIYYKDIELVGSLVLGSTVTLNDNLIADPVDVARTKAILYALSDRLKGKIDGNEQ